MVNDKSLCLPSNLRASCIIFVNRIRTLSYAVALELFGNFWQCTSHGYVGTCLSGRTEIRRRFFVGSFVPVRDVVLRPGPSSYIQQRSSVCSLDHLKINILQRNLVKRGTGRSVVRDPKCEGNTALRMTHTGQNLLLFARRHTLRISAADFGCLETFLRIRRRDLLTSKTRIVFDSAEHLRNRQPGK